ncbi:hypothetical protein V5O48_017334, partial [Marasmius crinis-equi]
MRKRSFGFSLASRKRSRTGVGTQRHVDRVEFDYGSPIPESASKFKEDTDSHWIDSGGELKFDDEGVIVDEAGTKLEWDAEKEEVVGIPGG